MDSTIMVLMTMAIKKMRMMMMMMMARKAVYGFKAGERLRSTDYGVRGTGYRVTGAGDGGTGVSPVTSPPPSRDK